MPNLAEPPAEPDFQAMASAGVRRITEAPQPRGATADPIVAAAKIIKADLESAYAAGRGRGFDDAMGSLPHGSLIYQTQPREHSGMSQRLIVAADEQPMDHGGVVHFQLYSLSYGDRALLRALCDLMIERLDATESQERRLAAKAEEGDA